MSGLVLALCDDLIFASRIELESTRAGAAFRRVGTQAALQEVIRTSRPKLVVVDLDGMGFDGVAAIESLRDEREAAGVRVIAYGSHVEPERLAAALAAGAADSMARSEFVRRLPAEIRGR
jgi:DNA-binding response OmpR family regulator